MSVLGLRVQAMVRDGQLLKNKKSKYAIDENSELVSGSILAHRDGYAFVRPDVGGVDIYLSGKEARPTFHGDKVLVKVSGKDRRDRPFGTLVEVLERTLTEFVGQYFEEKGVAYVTPDDPRINQRIIINDKPSGLANGLVVSVTIVKHATKNSKPIGKIKEIVGEIMSPGMEVDIAIRTHQLPYKWPKMVTNELKSVVSGIDAAELQNRRDLRDLAFVTIDGADAKDFDDAIFAESVGQNKKLCVAIADVSHYVLPDSALDVEAKNRGTSVYFPDQVVPMLPEKLSNEICSLVPHEDRLVLVCEMLVSPRGKVIDSEFYSGVVCSNARLTYEDVQHWLDGDKSALGDVSTEVEGNLLNLHELYTFFKKARIERGALEIGTVEPKFNFNAERKIESIEAVTRFDAHKIVEECMIAANTVTADFLLGKNKNALFRAHDVPAEDKVQGLVSFLRLLGINLEFGKELGPHDFSSILNVAKGRKEQRVIETMVLRSLKLAVYCEENLGHFGLGLDSYAHFTSPIRRYPDLIAHRAIKSEEVICEQAEMQELALHCSTTERRAELASRDVVAGLKCEYMLDRIGDEFSGVVTATTDFGLFVELGNIFIEGLVHVTSLPRDYYTYSAETHSLCGKNSGTVFGVGQSLKVVVSRVSIGEKKIDLVIANGSDGVLGRQVSKKNDGKIKRKKFNSKSKSKKKKHARK